MFQKVSEFESFLAEKREYINGSTVLCASESRHGEEKLLPPGVSKINLNETKGGESEIVISYKAFKLAPSGSRATGEDTFGHLYFFIPRKIHHPPTASRLGTTGREGRRE